MRSEREPPGSSIRRLVFRVLALAATVSCSPTRVFPIRAVDASLVEPTTDGSVDVTSDGAVMDLAHADTPAPDGNPLDVARDLPIITTCPTETRPVGYASAGPTPTTGGEGGTVVKVTTLADLMANAALATKLIIQISGTITLTDQVRVKSDKTIEGVAPGDGLLGGGLNLVDSQNIIIRRLTIAKAVGTDAITLNNTKNVWIDHCDLSSIQGDTAYDGLVDITHGSDWVTVSWTVFHDHRFTSLVGGSINTGAEDMGHLTVTYHHNYFLRTQYYNPRVRFGSVHVFNNLYEYDPAYKGTAIASQEFAQVLIEANVFKTVKLPIATNYEDPDDGTVWFPNPDTNIYIDCGSSGNLTMKQWAPPYSYVATNADTAEATVLKCAGPAN